MTAADHGSDGRKHDAAADDPTGCDLHARDANTSEVVDDRPNSFEFFGVRKKNGASDPVVQPGDRFGEYEVLRKIGEGGMGEVWLARHEALQVDRAIKLLDPRVATDRHWNSRMLSEARILAKFNHPNIATLFEFIKDPSSCIVMEYVVGRTLADLIRQQTALPVSRSITICRQIAEALHYAHCHQHPAVHRDLKPKNIMVRDDDVVKVLDWGIAQVLIPVKTSGREIKKSRKTPRIAVAGTPGYMSPEQAFGKQADRRADIWALGCVLYEMLTGAQAFPHKELDSFIEAVISPSRHEPDWSRLPPHLPAALEDLLRHCLERDLHKRLDRAELVLERLRSLSIDTTKLVSGAEPAPSKSTETLTKERSRRQVPSNIPPAMTSFVGREHVMEKVRAMLRQSRMLTLTGPGGTGKTTLAMRLARALLMEKDLDPDERFTGGIWLVELASVSDHDLVMQTIEAALPGRPAGPSGTKPVDMIATSIGEQSTLLILDNCEHLCDTCRDVASELLRRCPNLRIIATSRQRLYVPGEQVRPVPPLTIPKEQHHWIPDAIVRFESIRLFVERAKETRPDFTLSDRNAADVAKICRMLDGLPLAIELAAARTSAIAVRQLAERIADQFRALDRQGLPEPPGHGGSSNKRRALHATINWSYGLLSETEKRIFARLSIFRGGWTLDAAEAIIADEESASGPDEAMADAPVEDHDSRIVTADSVIDLIEGLVEKSLVTFEEVGGWPRYRMYETVRQFAEQVLSKQESPEDIERLRAQHADFFLQLAGELRDSDPGPRQTVTLERIENDHDNFRAAMEWALSREDQADLALKLANGLHWFYFVRGYGNEGMRWLRAALTHRPQRGDLLEGRAYNSAGMLTSLLYDYDAARRYYQRSLDVLREHEGQDHRVAAVLNNLGMLAQTREDRRAAFDAYEEAVAIYDRLDQPVGRARVQLNLAAVNMFSDRLKEAKSLLESSLSVLSREQDDVRVAEIHQLLCEIAEREGRRDDAVAHFRQSISLRERNREHGAILRNFVFAAIFASDAGRYETAARLMAYIAHRKESEGAAIPDRHRQRAEEIEIACREQLSEQEFARALAEGNAMEWADVCELARGAV